VLEALWRECGLTLILVTHDTMIARRAHRVGVMSKGRLSIRQGASGANPVKPG
jgi:putative ABC transport system ATP-binding protein